MRSNERKHGSRRRSKRDATRRAKRKAKARLERRRGHGPDTSSRRLAAAFLRGGGWRRVHAKALYEAVPRNTPLHRSEWILEGVGRAHAITGLRVLELAGLLEAFLRWCYRAGHVPQVDVAIQLANLQIMRRRHGEPASTVEPPGPRSSDDRPVDHVRAIVASWEAMSYAEGVIDARTDEEETAMLLWSGSNAVIHHLAETDGVPVRFDRLHPAAFALELFSLHQDPDVPPPPPGYATHILGGTASFYDRVAERGYVDRDAARRIARELRALATSGAPSRTAA